MRNFILLLFLVSLDAGACMAFLEDEFIDGSSKVCIYDHLGSTYVVTVQSFQICQVTVTARH